ncbi:MAG: NAD(P)H-binding protein [Prevotellaceae bacterium]|jgi:uncharacterized protein YbjT (DUF2867 family)|nr:NAD(P)H-binding protein [Prevotellaceae bacterium]
MNKKAIVIGATGLVGSELIDLLLQDDNFGEIAAFVRRPILIEHPKLKQHIIDFAQSGNWQSLVTGDVLFSALGTTLRQAKGKANQYRIDYTFQYNFAKIAAENGVKEYVLVSSAGANAKSMFFYMRMKGGLENAVLQLPFSKIVIIRPAQLYGNRKEKRTGENLGLMFTKAMNKIGLIKSFLPIHARTVARAMINSLKTGNQHNFYSKNELFGLTKNFDN